MAAAAHDPAFAARAGVPVGVAQEFNRADSMVRLYERTKPAKKKRVM